VADSARPEIIAEIKAAGFRIIPCEKGAGSIKRGIDRVQEQQIIYAGSNLKREFYSYQWKKRADGESTGEPQDGNDHIMDALRYAIDDLYRPRFDF
jgi:phage terminase large subunit